MNVVPRIFVGARRKGRFAPFARKSRRVPRIFWPIRQDLSLPPVRRFALPYGRSIIAEQYRFWFSSTTTPTQSFRKAPPRSLSVKPILGGGPRRRRRQAAPRTKATHRNVSFGDRCVAGAVRGRGSAAHVYYISRCISYLSGIHTREYTSDECPGHGLYVMEETLKILIS